MLYRKNRLPWDSLEAYGAATGIGAIGDVVENLRMGVKGWIDKANRFFASCETFFVDLEGYEHQSWHAGSGSLTRLTIEAKIGVPREMLLVSVF